MQINQGAAFKLKDEEVYIFQNNISGSDINDTTDVGQLKFTAANNADVSIIS